MKAYPILLNLSGKLATVVGGGAVGKRRSEMLLACGARVRLVDPSADVSLQGVERVTEEYQSRHLDGAQLVFACTDNREVNARIALDARARGAWVNVADDPAASDFSLPAVHHGAGVVLAVGTVGGAPTLAGEIRDALVKALPAEADGFALAMSVVREKLKSDEYERPARQQILRRLSGPEGQAAYQGGGVEALLAMVEQMRIEARN